MKKLSFLLLFLGMQWCALAKPELIISLNMNECANCYNALSNLKDLDSSFSLKYILPEEYEVDSIELKEYLSLPNQGEYLWSNALNNKYLINNVFSSITLVTENENMSFLVKEELDKDLVKYFNSLLEEEYIYDFKDNIFKVSNKYMKYYKNWVFISNNLTKSIIKANFITGESKTIIKYTDKVINEAYQLANKDKDLIFGIGEKYGIKNQYTPVSFDVYKDKVYLMTSYLDYHFENNFKDTLQLKFLSLQVFDLRGTLLNTFIVESTINNENIKKMEFFTIPTVFSVKNDSTFNFGLLGNEEVIDIDKDAYFLGEYNIDNQNKHIKFKKTWPFVLGEKYKYINYNLANSKFSPNGKIAVNVLNDSVYVNEGLNFKSYSLNLFKDTNAQEIGNYDIKEKNVIAAKDNEYIYVLFVTDDVLKYYKMDLKTNAILSKNIALLNELSRLENFLTIDHFNNDYLITPINHNQIKRYKTFK